MSENTQMKKYTLTEDSIITSDGVTLCRIQALISFDGVRAGDMGGYIENESNLSHLGSAWVADDARVYGSAMVYGNARVSGTAAVADNAHIFGCAWLAGSAIVEANAMVYGNARVYGNAFVEDNAHVYGNAHIYGSARVCEDSHVYGNAHVSGFCGVHNSSHVFGDAQVFDNARLENAEISENAKIYGRAKIVCSRVFGRAHVYGNASVADSAMVFGDALVCGSAVIRAGAKVFSCTQISSDTIEGESAMLHSDADGIPFLKMPQPAADPFEEACMSDSDDQSDDNDAITQELLRRASERVHRRRPVPPIEDDYDSEPDDDYEFDSDEDKESGYTADHDDRHPYGVHHTDPDDYIPPFARRPNAAPRHAESRPQTHSDEHLYSEEYIADLERKLMEARRAQRMREMADEGHWHRFQPDEDMMHERRQPDGRRFTPQPPSFLRRPHTQTRFYDSDDEYYESDYDYAYEYEEPQPRRRRRRRYSGGGLSGIIDRFRR